MKKTLGESAWVDVAALAMLKIAVSLVVLAMGFRAVSDDDFARTVIAEAWAKSPRLDPSGTSWLPLPFWIQGSVFLVAGRSLDVARATSIALGAASIGLVYAAARSMNVSRGGALAGAAIAAVFPWSARLGAATVPELPAAALALFGIASIARQDATDKLRWLGALCLAAASLCRYEAWPLAAACAALGCWEALRDRDLRRVGPAIASLAGAAAWVAWNRVSHGAAFHFLARVTAYKRALGASDLPWWRVAAYPMAILREEPEIVAVVVLFGVAALLARVRLQRYTRPAALVAVLIVALSVAMVNDGAPTHHVERAVLVVFLLGAVFAGDVAAVLASAHRAAVGAIVLLGVILTCYLRPELEHEMLTPRLDEVAIGRAARAQLSPGTRVLVEVDNYGFLAIEAAIARPEDVVEDRSIDPRDTPVVSSFTDESRLRGRLAASGASWFIAERTPAALAVGAVMATSASICLWRVNP